MIIRIIIRKNPIIIYINTHGETQTFHFNVKKSVMLNPNLSLMTLKQSNNQY